jgi:hypothetical protein
MDNDQARKIESIFGGVCPWCGGDLALTKVGGTSSFLAEDSYEGDFEVNEWEPADDGEIGELEFQCAMEPEDHVHSVFGLHFGDGPVGEVTEWVLGG